MENKLPINLNVSTVFVNSGIRQLKEDKGCHVSCFGDTCIQDFACSIGSDRYPVHLFSTDNSVQAKIIIGNDNTYIINGTAREFHIPLDSASTLAFFPEPKFEIKRYNINVRCYKKFDTAPLCQLPEDPDFPDLANTIILLNEGKDAGSVRNVHLEVHQLIPDIPDNVTVYLLDSHSGMISMTRRKRHVPQRIPELKSLRNALIYLARESAFNDFHIIKSLSDVQNAFLQFLNSVSYRDPEVLGGVIGRNKQTSWFSDLDLELLHGEGPCDDAPRTQRFACRPTPMGAPTLLAGTFVIKFIMVDTVVIKCAIIGIFPVRLLTLFMLLIVRFAFP
ncbi:unnamed protein product [Bemisia tabaci]|uniref:Uncharacterized protein n=1 Tax=Bemisia tabaci TaxID=7038 RepID=A0A9P0F7E8_BEMTA|nr:unnamed protein product [Bemisia tabaci]